MAKQTIEEQLNDIQPMSYFEKSLAELGVTVIHAYSPQSKGRVERLFGTFQDRVVTTGRSQTGACLGSRPALPLLEISSKGNDQSKSSTSSNNVKPDISALVRTGHFSFGLTLSSQSR
jgi:hypothetical protein